MKEFVRETEDGNLYVDDDCDPSRYTLVSHFSGREYASCRHGYAKEIKDGGGVITVTDGLSGTQRSYCLMCIMDFISSKMPEL